MQPPFDIAADLDTPVSAFLKLRPFRPRFLLESADGGERLGRYSFIGLGDGVEVDVDAGEAPIEDGGALLRLLRGALARAPRPRAADGAVPFAGGLVGFTGFDAVRLFEPVLARDRAVSGPVGRWFAPRSVVAFDHLTRAVALLHDGDDAERESLRAEVVRALRGPLGAAPRSGRHGPPAPSLDRDGFVDAVREGKRHIAEGDLFQLVLSVRFEGATDADPFQVYRALRILNPSPYMYFLDLGGTAVVGSSPESLVRLDGRRARLRPIAGTRRRGDGPDADALLCDELLSDPKEHAEHVMLVDLARNDLGRVSVPGTVAVAPYRAVERYSHVMHLVSGVESTVEDGIDAFDLFGAAFPAGTVSGAPKIRAVQRIDELEPVARGVYAGAVGYFGHGGRMDQAIAIRTLTIERGRYAYQAGAGIVADSDPEREHDEVLAKGAALRAALALAEEEL